MRIGEVLEYTRLNDEGVNVSDVKVDFGGGNIVQGRHYAAPGDDAFPLVGDFCLAVQAGGTGNWVVVGFLDPEFVGVAEEGERVLCSRSAQGTPEATIHLKADGTTEVNGTDPVAMSTPTNDSLESLRADLATVIDAVSQGLTAVGAGTLANGPAGASTFDGLVVGLPAALTDVASQRLKSE